MAGGGEMLNYFNPWISIDNNTRIGGEYSLKTKKIIWRDYSKNHQQESNELIISKILSYSALSSPLVMIPLLNLFSEKKRALPLIDVLGGKSTFWLLTIVLGIFVSQSIVYRVYLINSEGEVCDEEPPLIVQKNIMTNDINIRIRHNQGNGGIVSLILSKIPYVQFIPVSIIFIVFMIGAYLASNDMDSNLSGHLFFYIILVILVATVIGWSQLALPIIFIFIKFEKKLNLAIKSLDSEQLKINLDKAEQFYKEHQVSKTGIKRYLSEYRKLLKEKEMEHKT